MSQPQPLEPNIQPAKFDVWIGLDKRMDRVAAQSDQAVVFTHKSAEPQWKLACAPREVIDDKDRMLSLYRALQAHCRSRGWLDPSVPSSPKGKHEVKTASITVPLAAMGELNLALASKNPQDIEALKRKYPQNGPKDNP